MPFLFTMPKISPTMTEGTIARWLKKEGDFVQAGEALVEITSDKSTIEQSALDEGWLRKIVVAEGEIAPVNDPIAIFSATQEESIEGFLEAGKKAAAAPPPAAEEKRAPTPTPRKEKGAEEERGERLLISPLARKMACEKGIDLSKIKGSGPNGRIVARDLEEIPMKEMAPPPGNYDEIALSPIRKAIAHTLQMAKQTIPHFYLSKKVNAEPMIALRAEMEKKGVKITFNDFIIKASALALKKYPEVNTGFHPQHETLLRYKTVDVSVAVATKEGLITPIIKNTDTKNITQLSSEMKELKEKALAGHLKEEEYRGGSFTISNLGMFKISEFIAVINPPQGALLAVGAIEDMAVVKEGQLRAGKVMTLTLSCDHRVMDGSTAAQFLITLADLLEKPEELVK